MLQKKKNFWKKDERLGRSIEKIVPFFVVVVVEKTWSKKETSNDSMIRKYKFIDNNNNDDGTNINKYKMIFVKKNWKFSILINNLNYRRQDIHI